jgi:hypothetical protein
MIGVSFGGGEVARSRPRPAECDGRGGAATGTASVDDAPSAVATGDGAKLAVACAWAARSGFGARLIACLGIAGFGASVADKPWSAAGEIDAIGVRSGPGAVARSTRLLTETGVMSLDDLPSSVPTEDCDELAIACAGAAGSGSRSLAGFEATIAGKPWGGVEEAGTIGVPFVGDGLAGAGPSPSPADCDGVGAATAVVTVDDVPSPVPTGD